MNLHIKIKRGLDIPIIGKATPSSTLEYIPTKTIAITPDDFPGITPKPEIKIGDRVKSGTPIIYDKNHPEIKITSPISGTITDIVRGERRKIEHIIISSNDYNNHECLNTTIGNRDNAKDFLLSSGLWVALRQRPYDIVPSPDVTPRDIFVTAFDSSPLAPDFDYNLNNKEAELEAGAKLLRMLTDGNLYFAKRQSSTIADLANATNVYVTGPHPAGNAGIQVANISPVNKGETVWTLDAITLMKIGDAVLNGKVDYSTIVAITGSEVTPRYISTIIGAEIAPLIGDLNNPHRHKRIISGNVLTGSTVSTEGYLRFPYRHITIIPEGDDVTEFMGWASLSPKKMSVSRSFPGHFLFKKLFSPDARLLGSRRAMIMSGEYDKVLPMDIMAEYLIKAILSRNIDQMEKLGIYEIAPEDLALCEYVDTSKLEIQKIVREGLDYLRKELE